MNVHNYIPSLYLPNLKQVLPEDKHKNFKNVVCELRLQICSTCEFPGDGLEISMFNTLMKLERPNYCESENRETLTKWIPELFIVGFINILVHSSKSYMLSLKASHMFSEGTHVSYDPAGPDAVVVAHPALVIRILPPGQYVLIAHVVGPLIQHPGPALHANRVAAAEVGVELGTVTLTLIIATLEVFVFIEHDLEEDSGCSVDALN